jgi:hypothetical protein
VEAAAKEAVGSLFSRRITCASTYTPGASKQSKQPSLVHYHWEIPKQEEEEEERTKMSSDDESFSSASDDEVTQIKRAMVSQQAGLLCVMCVWV